MNKDIKRYRFKEGFAVEFEIMNIGDIFRRHKDILTSPHRAEFYHVIWIQRGTCVHHVDFMPIELPAGSILFVPRNCVNHFDSTADFDGKVIIFTDEFFCKDSEDTKFLHTTFLYNNLYDITQIKVEGDMCVLGNIFRMMENEVKNPNDYAQSDILKNYLYNFLLISEREKRSQGYKEVGVCSNLEYLLSFKTLLENRFKSDKLVSKYAVELNISEKRLNKATGSILGKTPKEMIAERVLLEAKRLLVYSELAVKEVAYDLGFEEATNFIKYFRKQTGKTPSDFREYYRQQA